MQSHDELDMNHMRDLAAAASRRGIAMYSDFLNLSQQSQVLSLPLKGLGVSLSMEGGYEQAERKLAVFVPADVRSVPEVPITCMRILPKAQKYAEDLTHRDILGTVLGLGLDRPVIGDILAGDKCWYLFCLNRMADYIQDNLIRIRHTSVQAEPVIDPGNLPSPHLDEKRGTLASVRLDSLIRLAFNESRTSLSPLITEGRVFVNGREISSPGYEPKPGDIISVRGKGRFRFEGVQGSSKKNRLYAVISLYV